MKLKEIYKEIAKKDSDTANEACVEYMRVIGMTTTNTKEVYSKLTGEQKVELKTLIINAKEKRKMWLSM